jgi:protein gp37
MGEATKIEWCDHTFNPVRGCIKVSPECKHCYAEARDVRYEGGKHWGPNTPRIVASDALWRGPLKWNRDAEAAGVRRRVFCASLADVFEDHPDWIAPRERLFKLIDATQNLDWLLLTKRPENFERFLPWRWQGVVWGKSWPNVWLGVTAGTQETANTRIPILQRTPAVVRFVSVEPMLEFVDLKKALVTGNMIDWLICGGESGGGARAFHLDWARALRDQCIWLGVSFFMKQLGRVPVIDEDKWRAMSPSPLLNAHNKDRAPAGTVPLQVYDNKGGDWDRWPGDLRYRNFPEVRS